MAQKLKVALKPWGTIIKLGKTAASDNFYTCIYSRHKHNSNTVNIGTTRQMLACNRISEKEETGSLKIV